MVAWMSSTSDRIGGLFLDAGRVGFAEHSTALNSAAGDGDGESVRPMVAAAERIQFGRAAKFTAAKDDGAFEANRGA